MNKKLDRTPEIARKSDIADDVGLHILAQCVISQSHSEENGLQIDPTRASLPVWSMGELLHTPDIGAPGLL